ncbi:MAG: hypothetical protein JWP43_3706 [Ramlibacter sp.]|nr:hypothetical protein [Ramlibacter sp.]
MSGDGSAGDAAGGAAAAGVSASASTPSFARILLPRPRSEHVDLGNTGPVPPAARFAPAAPAVVAVPTETGGIRYWPEQNMIELVEQPRPADAAMPATNAMGAAAVGQPVRSPRIEARPLEARQ